jgi:glycosyltransferase involved in cell wall biosynthesis
MRRALRFLHISTFYPPWSFGGDAMYIYRLSHALADDGHEVDVAHCRDAYHLLHPGAPPDVVSEHSRVRVHDLQTPVGSLAPLVAHQTGRPVLKRRQLQRLLAERRPDVVHFHNVSLLGPSVLGIESDGLTPLRLYTAHEHWLVCPTHVLWKFAREVCTERQCLACTLHARRPPQLWRATGLLDRQSRHVHQFIAPSRFVVRSHAERGFGRPMTPLPLFVDDTAPEAATAPPHPRPYVLFVGRLEAIKGLQTVIPLWDRVGDLDLVVAGSGGYEDALRAQASANPRIRFLGHVPQRDLAALYRHAFATIVPSLTYETFGIIVIESLSHGTPVIARDLGSLTELVEESGGGLLYETDIELVAAIARLAAGTGERQLMGARGRAAFERRWSRTAHLRQYYALLDETARAAFGHVPWES